MLVRNVRRLGVLGIFSLVACAHSGAATSGTSSETTAAQASASSPEAEEAAESLKAHHRHHHHGGITAFIAMALETLGSDPARHTEVEKIQADLNGNLTQAREAEKSLMLTLADGIGAGKIDAPKVDAAIAHLTAVASTVHESATDSLNKLHAILTPAERSALADKVQSHWEVWRKVNYEAEPGGREAGGHLANLTEEVGLTSDQADKISSALHTAMADLPAKLDAKEAEAQVHEFATAFAGETFDAKTLSHASKVSGHLADLGAQRMAIFYETVTPLLTPEQRTKLSARMHEHLNYQHPTASK